MDAPDPPKTPPERGRGRRAAGVAAALGMLLALPANAQPPGSAPQPPDVLRIGVLVVLDEEAARLDWQPLADGLARRLAPRAVQLQVHDLDGLEAAAERGELSFVVTNPGHYVKMEAQQGATRIATHTTEGEQDPAHVVGSALVVRAGPGAPTELAQLRGRRVAAVSEQAFGGYQLIAAEWSRLGIDAERGDIERLFTGFPMSHVVDAVLDGRADAGILRTCLLERLEREGRVPAGALQVVGVRPHPALPCRSSTPLYPGWAFAALPDVPRDVSREILLALLTLPPDARGTRWSVPADYQPVHEVLRALEVEPYAFLRAHRLEQVAKRYWFVIGALGLLMLLHLIYTLRVEVLVKHRTAELRHALAEKERLAHDLERDHAAMDHLARLSIVGELSATLSHELSHPLATIGNYAASLQRRAQQSSLTEPVLQQGLREISGEAERAAHVLQGIRALARKRVSERRECDVAQLVNESVALFRGMQVSAPDVAIRVEDDEVAAARVRADPLQLQQVLLNLLKNAQDVMREPGAWPGPIEVRLALAGDEVTIAVVDSGPPMAEADRARLFEPFFTTKPAGLGLGLPICSGIVEAHGGTLSARPADPGGTLGGMVFEVRLPVAAAGHAAPSEEKETET